MTLTWWHRRSSIGVAVACLSVLIAVLVMGLALYANQRQRLTSAELQHIEAVAAVQKARVLDSLNEDLEVDILGLLTRQNLVAAINGLGESQQPPPSGAIETATAELESALVPVFSDLLILHQDGLVIAATDETRVGTQYADLAFVAAAATSIANGDLFLNSRGQLVHPVGGPVAGPNGVTHILVLESDQDALNDLTSDYSGLGATGETVLAQRDEHGDALFVTPLRFDADAAFNTTVSQLDVNVPIIQALQGNESLFADTLDYRENEVFSATRHIPKYNLGLVVKIDRSEALANVHDFGDVLKKAYVIFAIVHISISLFVARALAKQGQMRMLSSVFAGSLDPMIIEDRDGVILDVNEEAIRSYGWSREELIGNHRNLLVPPDRRQAADEYHTRFWAGETVEKQEGRRRTKSGAELDVLIGMSPLASSGHTKQVAVTVAKDMTEFYAARRQALDALSAAESANQAKSEFMSRMSHELRTPLNSVLGFAQILEMSLTGKDNLESVDYIRTGGEHLLHMVDDILDLTRIESGTLDASFERVEVRSLVSECLGLVSPQIAERQIEVNVEPGPELFLWADNNMLRQVILNLLSNAIKYNHSGGMIAIGAAADLAHVRLTVADTGPGISPDLLGKLFLPFERLDAGIRGIQGTGLGLAVSKRLIETMGGSIGVHSIEGQGSTFWFEVPIDTSAEAAADSATTVATHPSGR